jgi:hypothetical protein
MASTLHLKGIEQAYLGNIDFESDTIKLAFMDTGYTPNAGTDSFYSDISASVASGSTDQTLAGKDIRIDTGNSRVEFDADDVSVASQTFSTNKVTIYKDTGTPATSPLIATIDIAEGTLAPIVGTISISFNTEGIFAINND